LTKNLNRQTSRREPEAEPKPNRIFCARKEPEQNRVPAIPAVRVLSHL